MSDKEIECPKPDPTRTDNIVALNWLEVYKDVCANIRATDEISFSLLRFVPVVAGGGAGTLTVLEKMLLTKDVSSFAVLGFSLIGFGITFGIFRWELRNIQKCNWLVDRAAELERYALDSSSLPQRIQYAGWRGEPTPRLPTWKWPWGKTEAETLIYIAALAGWLIPAALAAASLIC